MKSPEAPNHLGAHAVEEFWQKVVADWPDTASLLDAIFRVSLAAAVGALPGFQREQLNMPAGLRTHILVSVGAALFVLATADAGADADAQTRVVQGLATGIGFLGAGAILKSKDEKEIHGLTTAASIWITAALGTAVGLGRIWLPIVGSVAAILILAALRPVERAIGDHRK
jgi:putative Mg2+ transporter-C (MgtC) family protein